MTRKERMILVATCLAISLAGGIGTSLLLQNESEAYASTEPKTQDVQDHVRAKKLSLYDEKGTARAILVVQKGSPMFILGDPEGKARLTLALTSDSSPIIAFADSQDNKVLSMLLKQDGTGGYIVMDSNGKATGGVLRAKDGRSVVYGNKLVEKK